MTDKEIEEYRKLKKKEEKSKLMYLKLRVKNKLFVQKAKQSGIVVSDEEILNEIERMESK